MEKILNESFEAFEKFCELLMPIDNELDAQFEGWLTVQGKRQAIDSWKNKLS